MSAWRLGAIYKIPGGGERTRLARVDSEGIGTFETLDRKTIYVVPLSALSVEACGQNTGVSLHVTVDAQPALDAIADTQAALLARAGWYCISGKHLRIARVADPYVRASFETAPMPVETKVERLRRKLAAQSWLIEAKTVDVDTYVALKKLRRRQNVRPRNESVDPRVYQDAVVNAVRRSAGEVMAPRGAGKAAISPRRPHPAEVSYVNSLRALPDSLYKRTHLRYIRLPKDARKDHAARKKAFDREVAKYNKEMLK